MFALAGVFRFIAKVRYYDAIVRANSARRPAPVQVESATRSLVNLAATLSEGAEREADGSQDVAAPAELPSPEHDRPRV
jgi:hypothetical protein